MALKGKYYISIKIQSLVLNCIVLYLYNQSFLYRITFLFLFLQDFGISGLRVGVIHTWNKHVTESIKPLCLFAAVPAIVQSRLEMILKDKGKYNFQTLLKDILG